jgi:formylglycine-generating enzyme
MAKKALSLLPLLLGVTIWTASCTNDQTKPAPAPEKTTVAVHPNARPVETTAKPGKSSPVQSTDNSTSTTPKPASSGPCPENMVLVDANYCTKVVQECEIWLESPKDNKFARCKKFRPSVCKGERVHLSFCIDRYEAAQPDGMPQADLSWTQAKKSCEDQGKRLCQEREWTLACEGEEMRPHPYGFERSSNLCNQDRKDVVNKDKGILIDHRQPVTGNPNCISPFGAQNMVGNIDEWVVLDHTHFSQRDNGRKMDSGLKGGWWGPLRNRCRPTTVDHDELFHELQTGYRCCADTATKLANSEHGIYPVTPTLRLERTVAFFIPSSTTTNQHW